MAMQSQQEDGLKCMQQSEVKLMRRDLRFVALLKKRRIPNDFENEYKQVMAKMSLNNLSLTVDVTIASLLIRMLSAP